MAERTWKWFKTGYQFDIGFKAKSPSGGRVISSITVFCETKDKQDARREAIAELTRSGYRQVEAHKVISRW